MVSASSVTQPGTKAQLYTGTETTGCDRVFDRETPPHHQNWATPHSVSKIALKDSSWCCTRPQRGVSAMGGRWDPAKTVLRFCFFFFRLKRKLSFKQYYLLWQWFSSWKTSWAHFHGKEHCITPEPGTGTKEGSNSHKHQSVLLLEPPKPVGFSTTIFSIWFLAGIRKFLFFFLHQKPFWKSSTSHSCFASWPSIQKHGTELVDIYFPWILR